MNKHMVIDGNARVGEAKVYGSMEEARLSKRVEQLELRMSVIHGSCIGNVQTKKSIADIIERWQDNDAGIEHVTKQMWCKELLALMEA